MLKAIDNHASLYFKTGDVWHLRQASLLRAYVADLKTWIHEQEASALEEFKAKE